MYDPTFTKNVKVGQPPATRKVPPTALRSVGMTGEEIGMTRAEGGQNAGEQ